MFKKFGIDITVYSKYDKIEACSVTLFLVISAGLLSLIVTNYPVLALKMDKIRIAGIIILPAIFSLTSLYYSLFRKETRKLFLSAISLGIIIGSPLFILTVLYSDLNEIFHSFTL